MHQHYTPPLLRPIYSTKSIQHTFGLSLILDTSFSPSFTNNLSLTHSAFSGHANLLWISSSATSAIPTTSMFHSLYFQYVFSFCSYIVADSIFWTIKCFLQLRNEHRKYISTIVDLSVITQINTSSFNYFLFPHLTTKVPLLCTHQRLQRPSPV